MTLLTSVDLASRCAGDGEFQLAARYWTGGLRLEVGDDLLAMRLVDGVPSPGDPGAGDGVITLGGPVELWRDMLAPIPPRFANDVSPATALGLRRTGDGLLWWQYVPAIQRAIELLRDAPDTWSGTVDESGPTPRLDAPVGRYLHLDLDRPITGCTSRRPGRGSRCSCSTRPVRTGCSGDICSSAGRSPITSGSSPTTCRFTASRSPRSPDAGGSSSTASPGASSSRCPSRSPRRSSSTG